MVMYQPSLTQVCCRRSSQGATALHWAACNGHAETVKALIAARCDVGEKDVSVRVRACASEGGLCGHHR